MCVVCMEMHTEQPAMTCHQCGGRVCGQCENEIPIKWGVVCGMECLEENNPEMYAEEVECERLHSLF